ncbi:hypothetical protein HDU76_011531, partial [Blyttiomyces sp. JEL0837]
KRKWDVGAPTDESASGSTKHEEESSAQKKVALDAKDLAELAASKINAMLQSSQKLPSSSVANASGGLTTATSTTQPVVVAKVPAAKTEYVKDIEINDLKNRYLLTRGATQADIKKTTGADIVTRGKYYSDKSQATEKDPPLYLHITAVSEEILEEAVKKVEELIAQAAVPLVNERAGGYMARPLVTANVFVGFEPDRSFSMRAKIVGPGGAYVKHIQQKTGTKVILKGRGSGYEGIGATAESANEPMHIFI